MIYTLNFHKKKPQEKKFDVNTRYPRRARRDFRGLLGEILFLYLEFDMNNYLKNSGNYEVLRIKLGGFIITIIFIYGSFIAPRCFCLPFWNFAVLNVLHMH